VEYIYNPAGGGLLAMIANGAITYSHQDHLSVRLTTDVNGNVLTQEGTFPFGEAWYQSGSGNKLVFTSYNRDSESGLDYALARYYDSRTGTFCSADPLAGSADDPQSWNRYPYARNDPIDKVDPSGKFFFLIPLVEALVGAMEATLPEVVTTITVTATAAPWIDTLAPIFAGGGLAGAAALSQAPLSPRDMARFNKAQNNAQNNADNKDCQKFLADHGIDPEAAKNAISNMVPWNGAKSTISEFDAGVFDPQDPLNIQQGDRATLYFKKTSVASTFKNPDLMAMAQILGQNVYFKPGGLFSAGGLTPGTIFHEALHNLTGKSDSRLAQQLGLPSGHQESQYISPELAKHNCIN
jgi:RHS repeat-associated protein